MKYIILTMVILFSTGCANYQFGDISKTYCASTSPDLRELLKDKLERLGAELGTDYCETVGLIDAMVNLK